MKVLIVSGCDPVRYKYMKDSVMECSDAQLLVIENVVNNKIQKLIFYVKTILKMLKSDVIVYSNEMNIIIFRLSLLLHKQIIVDMYVSAYDTYILSRKQYPVESREANAILRNEQYIVKNASKLIFLSNSEKEYYLSVINVTPKKTFILPLFNNDKTNADLRYWDNKKETFNICWWGAEGNPIHGLSNLADALDILSSYGANFNLYIFGSDPQAGEEYYARFFSQKKWTDRVTIKYDYRLSNGKLIKFLTKNCSVALGPLSDEIKAKTVITNKALDTISMSIPLVTIESEGMREYFDDSMVYYCKNANPETIAEQLLTLMNSDKVDVKSHVNSAKEQFVKEFSIEKLEKQFVDIINEQ